MTVRTSLIEGDGAAANRRRIREGRVGEIKQARQPDESRGGRYGDRPEGGGKPHERSRPTSELLPHDPTNNRADDAGAEEEID